MGDCFSKSKDKTMIKKYVEKYNKRCLRCEDRMIEDEFIMFYGFCHTCRIMNEYEEEEKDFTIQ